MPVASTMTLQLTEEERTELLNLLKSSVVDTHAEARRTDNREYRSQIRQEEGVLRALLTKVENLGK